MEMPLPEPGMVASLRCCKGQELAWKVAGDRRQRRADLAGLASGTVGDRRHDGRMHSGGGGAWFRKGFDSLFFSQGGCAA